MDLLHEFALEQFASLVQILTIAKLRWTRPGLDSQECLRYTWSKAFVGIATQYVTVTTVTEYLEISW
jgi:hypothetical protein